MNNHVKLCQNMSKAPMRTISLVESNSDGKTFTAGFVDYPGKPRRCWVFSTMPPALAVLCVYC